MKIHLAVSSPGFSRDSVVTGHLCGREHSSNDCDGNNSTEARSDVTCALCLKVLADPKHWRYRKYLTTTVGV